MLSLSATRLPFTLPLIVAATTVGAVYSHAVLVQFNDRDLFSIQRQLSFALGICFALLCRLYFAFPFLPDRSLVSCNHVIFHSSVLRSFITAALLYMHTDTHARCTCDAHVNVTFYTATR